MDNHSKIKENEIENRRLKNQDGSAKQKGKAEGKKKHKEMKEVRRVISYCSVRPYVT
jgi:hypothetical protein